MVDISRNSGIPHQYALRGVVQEGVLINRHPLHCQQTNKHFFSLLLRLCFVFFHCSFYWWRDISAQVSASFIAFVWELIKQSLFAYPQLDWLAVKMLWSLEHASLGSLVAGFSNFTSNKPTEKYRPFRVKSFQSVAATAAAFISMHFKREIQKETDLSPSIQIRKGVVFQQSSAAINLNSIRLESILSRTSFLYWPALSLTAVLNRSFNSC